jgi:hypothetical protein
LTSKRSFGASDERSRFTECDKCGQSGQYRVERMVQRYGIDAKLFEWSHG